MTQLDYPSDIDWNRVEQPDLVLQRFPSRRSIVYGTKGVVASSQPLATEAGLEILRKGGNAGEPDLVIERMMELELT
jgi:gamma-glutamyltranspeptidase / glutathione hydrolase